MMPGMAAQAFAQDSQNLSDEKIKAEVCVIGGGAAGPGVRWPRLAGAKVVLLERESILGGTATRLRQHLATGNRRLRHSV